MDIDQLRPVTVADAHAAAEARGALCSQCPCYGKQRGPVLGEIRPNAKLTIIGEAPGPREVATGRVFTGYSGQELEAGLQLGDLGREDCTITNVISCQPPDKMSFDDYLTRLNRDYLRAVDVAKKANAAIPPKPLSPIECCAPRLARDIAESRTQTTLAVGGKALQAMAQREGIRYGSGKEGAGETVIATIAGQHGSPIKLPDRPGEMPGRILTASLHPAYAARGNKEYKIVIREDIARAARIVSRGHWIDWTEPSFDVFPSVARIKDVLEMFVRQKDHIEVVADIETDKGDIPKGGKGFDPSTCRIRCIGFYALMPDGSEVVIVVPFRYKNGKPWWPPEIEAALIELCRQVFDECKIVGHNFIGFDSLVLARNGMWSHPRKQVEDTMIGHHDTDHNDLPHKLGFVVARFLEAPLWKHDVDHKVADNVEKDKDLHEYCLYRNVMIRLADGTSKPIEDIVRTKNPGPVLSYNTRTEQVEARLITGWHRTKVRFQIWRQIRTDGEKKGGRGLIVTPDHDVYLMIDGAPTPVPALQIIKGDEILTLDDKTKEVTGSAHVTQTAFWKPKERDWANAKTRWCLSVDHNHNFFTNYALVANCGRDVLTTGRVWPKIRDKICRLGTVNQYRKDRELAPVMRDCGAMGLVINEHRRGELSQQFNQMVAQLRTKFAEQSGLPEFLSKKGAKGAWGIRSNKMIGEWLYDEKGYTPPLNPKGEQWEDGDARSVSTPAILRLLDHGVEPEVGAALETFVEFNACEKARGGFIDNLKVRNIPALNGYGRAPSVSILGEEVLPDREALSLLNTTYTIHVTPSGRTSSKPNVQNWSSRVRGPVLVDPLGQPLLNKNGKPVHAVVNMRSMVVAPPGHVIVGSDYAQIELRLYAYLAQDELLLTAFKEFDKFGKALDPHTLNAAVLFKKDDEDLMECYYRLKYDTPKGKLKYLRTIAKRFVYLVTYGGEEGKLFDSMFNERDKITGEKVFENLNEKKVGVWYRRWHALHPWTKAWQGRIHRMVREHGYVAEGGHFRKRFFPGGPSKKNAPPNHTVQGRAAAIMNDCVMKVDKRIPHGSWSPWTGIFLQVHDYIGLYVPEDRADEAIEIINECMPVDIEGLPIIGDMPLATWSWDAQG